MTKNTKDTAELIRAAYNGHYGYCKRLIADGANVNGKDRQGFTALHCTAVHAEKSRETEIIELLLDNGANIDIQTWQMETALHMAIREFHLDAAKMLIERGANVNIKDNEGFTALHSAASFGYTDICKLLLEHGADINADDLDGNTALYWAEENGHIEARELLLSYGAAK